jgi:3,4-dihydroxy 2-butanone 4-phosphate synthase/GTP cyclohydrolase II
MSITVSSRRARTPVARPVSRAARTADRVPADLKLTVEKAVRLIRAGRKIIVIDDEDRENEGDVVFAAQKASPDLVNFALKHGRGILCAPMAAEEADRLGLRLMVDRNTARFGTPFTESVDARRGTTTGTSAFDRAKTLRVLADPKSRERDLLRPGHIFPLRAVPGGVLRRAGHTEAVPDLCRLAGLRPVGALCEILSEDGRMARLPELVPFARRHRLGILTIRDLIEYRRHRERLVRRVVSVPLPTAHGTFQLILFESMHEGDHHVALVKGRVRGRAPVLVRVHSQCLTGDVFGSLRCDCGPQMHAALEAIAKRGRGVFLYLRQEGRGIGLANKLKAYALQDEGLDTVEANVKLGFPPDLRDYGIGAQILYDLGVRNIELLTNNPRKVVGLEGYGLKIVRRMPLKVSATRHNRRYLATKRDKLGHLLDLNLGET